MKLRATRNPQVYITHSAPYPKPIGPKCYLPYGPVIFAAPDMAPLAIFKAEWTYDPLALDKAEVK